MLWNSILGIILTVFAKPQSALWTNVGQKVVKLKFDWAGHICRMRN